MEGLSEDELKIVYVKLHAECGKSTKFKSFTECSKFCNCAYKIIDESGDHKNCLFNCTWIKLEDQA